MKHDLLAAALIVGGAVALYALGGLAPLWGAGANVDAGIWPFSLLVLAVVLGTVLGIKSAKSPRAAAPRVVAPTGKGLRNTLAVLAYVPALFLLGFYFSALVYAFLLPPLLGGVRWRASAVFALVFTAVLYGVFSLGLGMELPRGVATLARHEAGAGATTAAVRFKGTADVRAA